MTLILIILFPILAGSMCLLGRYATSGVQSAELNEGRIWLLVPIALVFILHTLGGWIPMLIPYSDHDVSAYWPDELVIVGVTKSDWIAYPGDSYPVNTMLEERYLMGYLAVTDEAAIFKVNKVFGPGTWPFSHSLEARVPKTPISWGDTITVGSGGGWTPKDRISRGIPIEATIEVPLGDINEPCRISGCIVSIQVTFPEAEVSHELVPMPPPTGVPSFSNKSGEAKSKNLTFWVLPSSTKQTVDAANRMIKRSHFNFFLFLAVFTFLNIISVMTFFDPYGGHADKTKPKDSKRDQRQLSLPFDNSQN